MPVLTTDAVRGSRFPVTFTTTSIAEYENLVEARLTQRTMLLKSPFTSDTWYVRFTGTMASKLEMVGAAAPGRYVSLALIQVESP